MLGRNKGILYCMVTIYISVVRPVVEYACPVWHTNLPIYLSDNIKMIKNRAVKAIFTGVTVLVCIRFEFEIRSVNNLSSSEDCSTDYGQPV